MNIHFKENVLEQASELEYAGFWSRVGATLIDTILMCILTVPLLMWVYGVSYLGSEALIAGPAELLISYVLPAVIVVLLWVRMSTTPGKMAIGATIVDARTGGKPTTGQFVIRYIGYYVSMLPLFLGFIWVGFDARKQGWHDKMAGTVVVRRKGGAAEPVRFEQPGG
jgi:uncharacterized RDD family membrane protein YckC